MSTKAQKIRVGIFFLVALSILLSIVALGLRNHLTEKLDRYSIMFEKVSMHGLEAGSPVKYHGVRVGRVEAIEIEDGEFNFIKVTIAVKKGFNIKVDSQILVGGNDRRYGGM